MSEAAKSSLPSREPVTKASQTFAKGAGLLARGSRQVPPSKGAQTPGSPPYLSTPPQFTPVFEHPVHHP